MNRTSYRSRMEGKIVENGFNKNQDKPPILDAEKVEKQLCILLKGGSWDF